MSIWVLASARSGSTFLAKIISNAIDQSLDEEFSSRKKYQNIQDFQNNPCKNAKVLHIQFNRIFYPDTKFHPDPSVEPERHLIKPSKQDRIFVEQYVQPTYIHLTRDPIDQALSYYMTTLASDNQSYFYMNSKSMQKRFSNKDIPRNDKKARSMYLSVKEFNNIWDHFLDGTNCVKIDYDNLNDNEDETIDRLACVLKVANNRILSSIDKSNAEIFETAKSHKKYLLYKEWFRQVINDIL